MIFNRDYFRDFLGIVVAAVVPLFLLKPVQNTPFIDDWVYAWPVEHWLQTGDLQILDNSTSINLGQILLGTIFCLPFGFSFTALRLSTWSLSVACLFGLYLTLRELRVSRQNSLIGVATLGLNPVYFILSFTFMTDIAFLTAIVWFSYALIRAVRQRSDNWLLLAILMACIATSMRVIGVALGGTVFATLLFHTGSWGRNYHRLVLSLIPFLFAAILLLWYSHNIEPRAEWTSPQDRRANLKYGFASFFNLLPDSLLFLITYLGISLLPIALSFLRRLAKKQVWFVGATSLLLVGWRIWRGKKLYFPLRKGNIWSITELGKTEPLVNGRVDYLEPDLAAQIGWILFGVAVISMAIMLASLIRRRYEVQELALIWLMLGQFVLMTILWIFNSDRYGLVFLPAAIALFLGCTRISHPRLALVGLAAFAFFSFVGVRDHLEYNSALWQPVNYLLAQGVPASEINGGYMVNGWLQYAHAENARLNEKGYVLVPWVNISKTFPSRYLVSNSLNPDYLLVKEYPYKRWLGRSGSIYLLDISQNKK